MRPRENRDPPAARLADPGAAIAAVVLLVLAAFAIARSASPAPAARQLPAREGHHGSSLARASSAAGPLGAASPPSGSGPLSASIVAATDRASASRRSRPRARTPTGTPSSSPTRRASTAPSPRTRPRSPRSRPAGPRGGRRSRPRPAAAAARTRAPTAPTTCSTSDRYTPSPEPGRDRQVDGEARRRRPRRRRVAGPVPGYSGDWWIETNSTRRLGWKMSLVPLPWWTSQSTIMHPLEPVARRAHAAATATLLNRQNPIARVRGGVMAGRAVGAERRSAPRRRAAVDELDRAAGSVQRRLERTRADSPCRRRSCPPPRGRRSARSRATYASGWTAVSVERATAGDCTRSYPSQSRRSSSRSIATIRAGRSGCGAGVVLERRRMHRGTRARPPSPSTVPAPVDRRTDPGRGRRRRRRRPLHGAVRGARRARAVTLVSATPLPSPRATGRRAGSRRRSRPDDSPELHLADTIAAGRGAVRESAARVLVRGGAGGGRATWPASACSFDADRARPARARARGRPLGPADRARRRRGHRPPAGPPAVGARRRSTTEIEVLEGRRVVELADRADGRCAGVRLDDGDVDRAPAPSCWRPAAPRRCGRGPPTRRARSAAACCSPTTPARRSPTSR